MKKVSWPVSRQWKLRSNTKFVTFGTSVIDKAIVASGKHQNELRITRVSPFVLWCNSQSQGDILDFDMIKEKSSYLSDMLCYHFGDSLSEKLRHLKIDFFCLDFLDVWRPISEFCFSDHTKVRITQSEILEEYEPGIVSKLEELHGKLTSKNLIEPLNWNETQLEVEMNQFMDWLDSVSTEKSGQLLVSEAYLPYQRIEKNQIVFSTNLRETGLKNTLAEKCIALLKKRSPNCSLIPKVDIFVGGQNSSNQEPQNYIEEYYSYLLANIETKFDSQKAEELRRTYMHQMQIKIDRLVFPNLIEQYQKTGKDRSVILFGSSEVLEDFPEFARHVYAVVPYSYQMPWNDSLIEKIQDKSEEYVLVFPHLFAQDNMLKKLFQHGYTYPADILTPKHETINLSQFTGSYSDVYHNVVTVKRGIVLHLQGNACFVSIGGGTLQPYQISAGIYEQTKLVIENDVRSDRLSIGLNPGSELFIGQDTTFADNNTIRATYLSTIIIDRDCMFSNKIYIQSGDGHNIQDLQTGRCINFTKEVIDTPKTTIHLEGHVWVGYETVLLAGTDIGAGSIIGARSMVKEKHPNNAIIVGSPAKTVKKDVAWTRNPFVTDLFSEEANIDRAFLQKTEEGEG